MARLLAFIACDYLFLLPLVLKFLNFLRSPVFLKNFLNLLANMANSSSSGSLSPSLSYFDALRAILFFFSLYPFSVAKSSSYEMRELIKSLRGKVFKFLTSLITVLLGLHSFGSDLMIFLTFSLFERSFLRLLGCSLCP